MRYEVHIPEDAKEIDAPSASKQVIALHKRLDKLLAKGVDAKIVDGRELSSLPDYRCTYYIYNIMGVLCIVERI